MINCNNCNVIVTKINFCSTKCRVEYHRGNAGVTENKPIILGTKLDPRYHPESNDSVTKDTIKEKVAVSNVPKITKSNISKVLGKMELCPHFINKLTCEDCNGVRLE